MKRIILLAALMLSMGAIFAQQTKPVLLNKASFLEKIHDFENNPEWKYKGKLPAVIDFYADWCGPCRRISPIIEKLANTYAGKVIVYKVDVDKNREIAKYIGVRGIPLVILIPMKGDIIKLVGARSESAYKAEFDKLIK